MAHCAPSLEWENAMSFKLWNAGALVMFCFTTGCIVDATDNDEEGGAGEGGQVNAGGSGAEGGGPAAAATRLFVVNVNQGVTSYADPAAQDGRIEAATTLTSGPDTDMYGPRDLALSAAGDLYVAAENDGAIVVYANALEASGAVLPSRKLKGPQTGLDVPTSIALDRESDTLYAVNSGSTGAVDTTIFAFDDASALDGDVAPSRSIEVDIVAFAPLQLSWHDGTLYAVTQGDNTASVLVFEDAGALDGAIQPTRTIANAAFGQVVSIYVDDTGLYAVDDEDELFVYAPGADEPSVTIAIDGAAKLSAIAFDDEGTMFLSDTSANVVYSFDGGAGTASSLTPSRTFDAVGMSLPARLAIFEP
jgi:hypothetical protein